MPESKCRGILEGLPVAPTFTLELYLLLSGSSSHQNCEQAMGTFWFPRPVRDWLSIESSFLEKSAIRSRLVAARSHCNKTLPTLVSCLSSIVRGPSLGRQILPAAQPIGRETLKRREICIYTQAKITINYKLRIQKYNCSNRYNIFTKKLLI